MDLQSRREFLLKTVAAGAAVALRSVAGAAGVGPVTSSAAKGDSADAQDAMQMAIARWKGDHVPDEELASLAKELTEQAIAGLGGMNRFVGRGDIVWIKPNIGFDQPPERAANTNPDVVAALVRLCQDAGAKKVRVGDHSCNWMASAYGRSGIADAAKAAGAEVVYVKAEDFPEVAINGKRLAKWPLCPEMLDCDILINVPVCKHHGLSGITCCMKNYMGVVGHPRDKWHEDIVTYLCDITRYMKPRLCVVDAVRVIPARGPEGGTYEDVKRMDTVAAGTDVVGLEAFGAELIGQKPEDLKLITTAEAEGLGRMNYRALKLSETALS